MTAGGLFTSWSSVPLAVCVQNQLQTAPTTNEKHDNGFLGPASGCLCVRGAWILTPGCLSAVRGQRGTAASAAELSQAAASKVTFPAQFACTLFVLDIAGDGAKSAPDGQKAKPKLLQRRRAKSQQALLAKVLGGASRGLAFGAGHLCKTRLRLIGPPL